MRISSRPISRAVFLRTIAAATIGVVAAPPTLLHAGASRRKPLPHPDPRAGITAANVLGVDALPDTPAVRDAYAAARAYPAIFDGLFCACRCRKSLGHRSLLSCFESRQPVGCLGCQEEAALAGRKAAAGGSLAEVRVAMDEEYG
jgi:hypothetical protein